MKKLIPLSLIAITSIYAAEIELAPISVESTHVSEVSQKAQVSADLAEALSSEVPSIDMSRRSGIANDIFIRGQKRDNISVTVDGTKVCGACPNRMDPPASHILANQIEEVDVTEGPYDVENFGVLSGGVKIKTKKPKKGIHGELNLGYGAWDYTKEGATLSAGNDYIRVLVSASTETSSQYKDGDGNTLAEQTANKAPSGNQYQSTYKDAKAYEKKSITSKAFVNVTKDQELRLSYTANRSDNILYPSTPMDAAYDNSNIYSVGYNIKDIASFYKDIDFQYYYSDVDHPMDTKYRVGGATKYMTAELQTMMRGVKLKNNFDINSYKLLFGLDGSVRMWQGRKYRTDVATGVEDMFSTQITHTDTENKAAFAKLEKEFGDLKIELGARYDSTDITPQDTVTYQKNKYSAFNGNILATYNINNNNKVFFGYGKSSRVPDARELYIATNGTDNLKQVTNHEIDLGYELNNEYIKFKLKGFYSILKDYIYYNKDLASNNFTNIDAKIYGGELSASIFATDYITIDAGISYKKGQKDKALSGQTDKDLADIAPLRGKVGISYEYMNNSIATIETQFSDKWSDYDADNGEQELAAWGIVNMKVKHAINKEFNLTVGVNNAFDKTYAQSNTYADLTLVSVGATTDKMLLNEPGRYVYTNLTYKF